MPNTAKVVEFQENIQFTDRRYIREIINNLSIPNTMGLMLERLVQKTQNDIKNDLDVLIGMWEKIKRKTLNSNAPSLIHEEGDLIYRVIRDFLTNDIQEIIIDGKDSMTKRSIMLKQ